MSAVDPWSDPDMTPNAISGENPYGIGTKVSAANCPNARLGRESQVSATNCPNARQCDESPRSN